LGRALGRPASWHESFKQHRYFACTILDRVYLLGAKYDCLDIHIHGAESILKLVDEGQGCLILGSHLGSFEVLRSLGARQQNFTIRVLMRHEQNRMMTEFLNELDPDVADVVIPLGGIDSLLSVQEAAAQGCLIGLLADRAASGEATHQCDFLGRPAPFPLAPMRLAVVLKVPVFLFFGIYRGGNRYDIYFEHFADPAAVSRGERDGLMTELAERYAGRLEHYARRAPFNWFNFYDFWQSK